MIRIRPSGRRVWTITRANQQPQILVTIKQRRRPCAGIGAQLAHGIFPIVVIHEHHCGQPDLPHVVRAGDAFAVLTKHKDDQETRLEENLYGEIVV